MIFHVGVGLPLVLVSELLSELDYKPLHDFGSLVCCQNAIHTYHDHYVYVAIHDLPKNTWISLRLLKLYVLEVVRGLGVPVPSCSCYWEALRLAYT